MRMQEIYRQVEEICEACNSWNCGGCEITCKLPGQLVIVAGTTREIVQVIKEKKTKRKEAFLDYQI